MKTRCDKGHFYSRELPACPYCDPKETSINQNITKKENMTNHDSNDKTKAISGSNLGDTRQMGSTKSDTTIKTEVPDFNKTTIVRTDVEKSDNKETATQAASRKIVGWLISFDHNPNGIDYRLYEGNNTIGRDSGNNIVIGYEASVSSKHALINFKKGRFHIKDEMAANGTYVNDEEIDIGQPVEFKDGCTLKFGEAKFKFRSVE